MVKKFMANSKVLNEANNIPHIIENFNLEDKNRYSKVCDLIINKKIKHIVTIARGSSDSVALFASYLIAKTLGITTYSLPPSVITLEKSKFDFSNSLVIIISQSGLSDDLILCSEECVKMGARILVITNNSASPIINNADFFFDINAKKEVSVAATKTYILSLINIIKLVAIASDQKPILDHLNKLPTYIQSDKENEWDPRIIDNKISKGFIVSRGLGYALATEISLKFKELALELIEPFSSAEVIHGPKTLIDNTLKLFILSLNDLSGKAVREDTKFFETISDRIYSINANDDQKFNFKFDTLKVAEIDSILLMSKFYPMIIKYSILKGLNPDKPRYLSKITKTL